VPVGLCVVKTPPFPPCIISRMKILITRHGHRADDDSNPEGKTIPEGRPLDPDISSLGIVEAKRLGQRIRDEFIIKRIYASPFLRTAHTAHLIAEEVGCKVCLEWGVAEAFYPQWFSEWPGTIERQKLADMFDTIYLPYEQTGVLPTCPEDQWATHDRLMRALERLDKSHDFLIVTHGLPVISIQAGLAGWPQSMPSAYCCSLSYVETVGDKWVTRMSCDTSHLDVAHL